MWKRIAKFLVPFGFIVSFLTWLVCSRYLTIELDFNRAFESTIQPPPSKSNSKGLSIQLNGVDGDKAIVGFQVPEVADKDGKIEWSHREGSSEELTLTPKKLEEIQANLRDLDPQKWQLLTKLPERLFRFNLLMFSDTTSPNNAKKESYFLVTVPINSAQKKVMPGEKFLLGKSLEIQEIAKVVADIKINLVYGMGMYMTFFSKNGELISQATGRMVIEPTFGVQASVFLGVWVMLVALVALLKKTLLIPREVGEVTRHYKRRNRYPG